jgi:hypothetical protein
LAEVTQARALAIPVVAPLAWAACLLSIYLAAVLLDPGGMKNDADSFLYESIGTNLASAPMSEWVAPTWPAVCQRRQQFEPCAKQGLFVEHLAGLFWPAALLERAGFPRGAVLANLVYFVIGLRLLFALARALAGREVAWAAVFAYSVSPLGLQYLVRTNHEPAWNAAFLGGLLALTCVRAPARRALLVAMCACAAFLVKGVLALSFFPILGLWAIYRGRSMKAVWPVVAAVPAVAVVALAYDAWFRHATGGDFFATYVGVQMTYMRKTGTLVSWTRLAQPAYYATSLCWFALPSSAGVLAALWSTRGRLTRSALGLCAIVAGGFVLVGALMSRRAVRYIFPAYALVHPAGMEEALTRLPRLRRLFERDDRVLHVALAVLLVAIALARLALQGHTGHIELLHGT